MLNYSVAELRVYRDNMYIIAVFYVFVFDSTHVSATV